jgi:PAS domain S-box-containing protein
MRQYPRLVPAEHSVPVASMLHAPDVPPPAAPQLHLHALCRLAVDHAPDGIALLATDGRLLHANEAFRRLAGAEAHDAPPRADDAVGAWIQRLAAGLEVGREAVVPAVGLDGAVRELRLRLARADDPRGPELVLLLSAEDVTAQRALERELREGRDQYQGIVETAAQGIWIADDDSRLTFVNQRAADALGYAPEELIGRSLFDVMDEEGQQLARGERANAFEPQDYKFRRRDGQVLWALASVQPILDRDGRYVGTLGMFTDITDRRRAEEERARLAAIVESSSDAISSETLDGVVVSWNSSAERVYGWSREEIRGLRATVLLPNDRAQEWTEIRARLERGERVEHMETVRVRKDGARIDVALTVSPVFDAMGRLIGTATISRDISEQRRIQ